MGQSTAVKILLLSHGIRQVDIADALGVDRSIVSKVVAGKLTSGPDATRTARAIAKAVRQPVCSLFPWVA